MKYFVSQNLTRVQAAAFKGECLTPENFGRVVFTAEDTISGDEYYVKKAVAMGAKAGKVIKPKAKAKPVKVEITEPVKVNATESVGK